MPGVKEIRFLVQHESCERKYGLNVVTESKNVILINVGVNLRN